MIGRIRQRRPLVSTTALFTIGIGVVGADAPGRCELPFAGQLNALGHGFIDVDVPAYVLLTVEADQVIAVSWEWTLHGIVARSVIVAVVTGSTLDLVLELVVEHRQVGVEAGQIVVVEAHLGIGGDFRIQIRVAYGGGGALTADAVQA